MQLSLVLRVPPIALHSWHMASLSGQHTRTTSTWLTLQLHPPLTLQLYCILVSLRFMLSQDLCLPMLLPAHIISSPWTVFPVYAMYLPNSYPSLGIHHLLQGAFPDFPPGWVKVLSRPHSANNHNRMLLVISTLVCELSAGMDYLVGLSILKAWQDPGSRVASGSHMLCDSDTENVSEKGPK